MYGKKLRELRKIEGWTQKEVAEKIGVSKQTYSHYENEERKPGLPMIHKLVEVYNVDINEIFSGAPTTDLKETSAIYEAGRLKKLPIVGQIACGGAELAYEEIEGYEEVPSSWLNGGEYYVLRAKGDSMINARINHGDLLMVRKQFDVENGEIAAVLIDGDATLKRVYKTDDNIILQSENSNYPPIFLTDEKDIKIIGRLERVILTF